MASTVDGTQPQRRHGSAARKTPTRKASRRRETPLVVPIAPRLRERATPESVDDGIIRCVKCRSTFVEREPAFLHCRYCGALSRIPNASLADQELYEIRSGLRLAS